ncbi:MAG: hypothetical protein GY896_03145 [Gammaproteobacteria bacterium]|nr:hypothetical protein [Gammaproteobacteria bacterium]
MLKTNFYSARIKRAKNFWPCLVLACSLVSTSALFASSGEILDGHYSRDGNNGSPSKTAGNNIYIKFFEDRWLGMMFIPYPYAMNVSDQVVTEVFDAARKQTRTSSYLRGKYGLLNENATIHIERYGYLEDRIIFECGSLAPCTIRLGDAYLELIKPGVINEHIIKYNHITTP